ncbi:MAG: GNAT family N-acetyltransferase, partial [Dehalococcoidia bacterium]|nr:GNAT family N-acetyltransferase [Dehalococcoidia bacterium]
MEGPRACTQEDFEETMALLNSIFRAGSDQRLQTDYPLIFRPSRFEYMRIIKENGKVVAHVPVAPREVIVNDDRFTVGIISPTGTHPDYRHRGHGTRCLRDCLRIMNENDWPVSVLWTREATFPFYQNSGYEPVGPQAKGYPLSPSEYETFERGSYDISLYNPSNPEHLDAVMAIHEPESLRIGRTRDDYAHYFNLHKMSTLLA